MAYRIEIGEAPERAAVAPLDDRLAGLLDRAVRAVLDAHEAPHAEISVTLVDDEAIARLNAGYLAHEGPTDVIAFALHDEGETPLGDVYIGREQAARQAAEHGVPLDEELARLAVHGTLHVLGYDHPEGEDREASEMWRVQEKILLDVLTP